MSLLDNAPRSGNEKPQPTSSNGLRPLQPSMQNSERYVKTYPISWEQLHRDSKALAWRLLDKGPFRGIVAVARGGLIPAAVIARELEVRRIETVCVMSYDWQAQRESSVLKTLGADVPTDGEGWLIVDDLTDTGGTARIVREMLPKALFATVYAKPEGKPLADVYVTEVSQDTWILFPWDTEHQYVQPLAARKE